MRNWMPSLEKILSPYCELSTWIDAADSNVMMMMRKQEEAKKYIILSTHKALSCGKF